MAFRVSRLLRSPTTARMMRMQAKSRWIIMSEGAEPAFLERWFSESTDVRADPQISEAVVRFLERHGVKSVVMPDRIIGCPHEEGIDYPEGGNCPRCPYWAGRDRFTGKLVHERVP